MTGIDTGGNLIAEACRGAGSSGAVGFLARFMDQALLVQLRTVPTVTGMTSLTSTVKR
jgi:hypothetical protein